MNAAERFLDSNVLLYMLSGNQAMADRAEAELAEGGTVSVQVLNEFASVATRKLGMAIPEVREILAAIRGLCSVAPLDEQTHDLGMSLVERYQFAVYDSMIVASALLCGCKVILSEDVQDGQLIDPPVTDSKSISLIPSAALLYRTSSRFSKKGADRVLGCDGTQCRLN
jgi:predicted nucleic acid-binding protein